MYVSMTYISDACNVQACLQISADAGAVRRQDCTHARDSPNEHDPRPARRRIARRHRSLGDRVSGVVSEYGGDNPELPRPLSPDIRMILSRSTRGAVRCATPRTVLSEDDRCIGPPMGMESITTSAQNADYVLRSAARWRHRTPGRGGSLVAFLWVWGVDRWAPEPALGDAPPTGAARVGVGATC